MSTNVRKLLNRIRRLEEEKYNLITENEDLKEMCESLKKLGK